MPSWSSLGWAVLIVGGIVSWIYPLVRYIQRRRQERARYVRRHTPWLDKKRGRRMR